jgi:hypothetical protein
MEFSHFDGVYAMIWIDKCEAYFELYQIPASFGVSAASLHLSGPAAHWYQTYKHSKNFQLWNVFARDVVSEFEDTHRKKSMELLSLKQTRFVDDYHRNFEQLVYNIRLYDSSLSEMMLTSQFIMGLVYNIRLYDSSLSEMMLTSQFIMGLKDEIRHQVELMLPESVAKAIVLAVMQEHLLQSSRKAPRQFPMRASVHSAKSDNKVSPSPTSEV